MKISVSDFRPQDLEGEGESINHMLTLFCFTLLRHAPPDPDLLKFELLSSRWDIKSHKPQIHKSNPLKTRLYKCYSHSTNFESRNNKIHITKGIEWLYGVHSRRNPIVRVQKREKSATSLLIPHLFEPRPRTDPKPNMGRQNSYFFGGFVRLLR